MGTFHDTQDPLHGITVAAVAGDTVYVGRCHERTTDTIVLADVDVHTEGQDERSNAEYLDRAAKFGVWKKHDRLSLGVADLTVLAPLSDYFRHPGKTEGQAVPVGVPAAAAGAVSLATEEPSNPVTLTSAAAAEVTRLLATESSSGQGLRLGVAGGGCSGLTYKVEFSAPNEGDLVFAQDDIQIFMDRKSAIYLRGVILDFEQGLGGKGFCFQNPNASNTCGCGESFAV